VPSDSLWPPKKPFSERKWRLPKKGKVMTSACRIIIVEDDAGFRNSFERTIASCADMRVVAACANFRSAMQHVLCAGAQIDIALVDLRLGDGSGIDLIRWMSAHHPSAQCIAVTVLTDQESIMSALRAGASGYLLKDASDQDFIEGIRTVLSGGAAITPSIARRLLHVFCESKFPEASDVPAESAKLSPREEEILKLIAKGMSVPEIAKIESISRHTVESHIKRIYQKLEVNSRVEAVMWAKETGLV
jgi:DNA-binding NarL/FixJ family response regulator